MKSHVLGVNHRGNAPFAIIARTHLKCYQVTQIMIIKRGI